LVDFTPKKILGKNSKRWLIFGQKKFFAPSQVLE